MYTHSELVVLPIAFLVILALTLLLRLWLKDKPEKVQSIPFIVIILLLLMGEIVKQVWEFRNPDGYDVGALPLHLCSTYLVIFSLAEVLEGNDRRCARAVAFSTVVYMTVGMYVNPRAIIGTSCDNIFASFAQSHTFFFHHLVLLYALLMVAFGRFQPNKKDALVSLVYMASYFWLACLFGHALGVNYFNVLHSDIPFFENFRLWAGQAAYTLVLGAVTTSAGPIFLILCACVRASLKKKRA